MSKLNDFLKLASLINDDGDTNTAPLEHDNVIPFVPHPYEVGEKYFIRTVTLYFTGILKEVYPGELVFDSVCWIADTGRFGEAIKTGSFNEQEVYGDDVIINRGSLIDIKPVKFELILETK